MNRRGFLLTVAIGACGGRRGSQLPTKRSEKSSGVAPDPALQMEGVRATNLRASPFAFDDDVLFHMAGAHELWKWNSLELHRVDSFGPALAFAVMGDHSVIILENEDEGCKLVRIARDGTTRAYSAALCGYSYHSSPLILRASTDDSLYLVRDDAVLLFAMVGFGLELRERIALPNPQLATREQIVSLADGRIVVPGVGGLDVLGPSTRVHRDAGKRSIQHLVSAGGEKVWFTYARSDKAWRKDVLVLATVDEPNREIAKIDVSPERIICIASDGVNVAVLLTATDRFAWSVAVFDDRGNRRWSVRLPEDLPAYINETASIGMSRKRVVLIASTMFAWDAANGAAIDVEIPAVSD